MSKQVDAPSLVVPESLIDIRTRRSIGPEADVADKTLSRALLGFPVQPSSFRRIREAMAKRGLAHLLPQQPLIPPARGRP